MNIQIENFFSKAKKWKEEYLLLRSLMQEYNELEETYKWMHPCYTIDQKNVVLIHGFKEYCAILFHKGVLINDVHGVLIQQTENVQSARQMRFRSMDEIKAQKNIIRDNIRQAIEIEKSGAKVLLKPVSEYPVPEEFEKALLENADLAKAFYSLSPGRQKGYLFYFNQAKQSKTRVSRIEKYYQHILDGKGMED